MFPLRSWFYLFCLCALVFTAACRGDTGSSVSAGSAATTNDVAIVVDAYRTLFENFGPGLTIALDPTAQADKVTTISATDELRQYSRQIICDPVGNGSMDGSVDDRTARGTIAIDIDFRNCAGVGGTVGLVGNFTRTSATTVALEWNYADSGDAKGGGCTIDLTKLTVASTVSLTEQVLADSQLSGTLSASCDDGSTVTCSWNGTSIADSNALAAACSCTGSGC